MTDVTSSDHDSSPWAQRGFILAAAFIAGLVLLGLALLVLGTGGEDSTGAGNDHSGARPSAATPARKDPNASVCGLPAGSQQIPAAPPETRWELVGTIAAPTAPKTIGPGIQEGKRRLCFAHSPTGALFAAVNFIAVAGRSPNDTALLRELTAEGRARDELLKQGSAPADSSFRAQVAGFRIDALFEQRDDRGPRVPDQRTGRSCSYRSATAVGAGRLEGRDRVGGNALRRFEPLQNLSGFVPWSGA